MQLCRDCNKIRIPIKSYKPIGQSCSGFERCRCSLCTWYLLILSSEKTSCRTPFPYSAHSSEIRDLCSGLESRFMLYAVRKPNFRNRPTLQGTSISPKNGILKMIFLFPRWDMLIPWRVSRIFERHMLMVQKSCNLRDLQKRCLENPCKELGLSVRCVKLGDEFLEPSAEAFRKPLDVVWMAIHPAQ